MKGRDARVIPALFALAAAAACSAPPDAEKEAAAPCGEPDVMFIGTPHDVVDMMLRLASVRREDVVYDLGCGDGRIVVAAAVQYGCRAVGYDIDPLRVEESRQNVRNHRVRHLVSVEQKDIFTLDLSAASVVTLYLKPELNVRLIPQLEKLAPGSRIVSHNFDMKGVRPDVVFTMTSSETGEEHDIYLWTAPLQKEPAEERENAGDGKEEEDDSP